MTEKLKEKNQSELNGLSDLWKFCKANILLMILISGLCFLMYANIINGKFVNLDDVSGVVRDPNIKNIQSSIKNFDGASIYKQLIYKYFELNSSAYHIGSIILHCINSILVFILFYILFGKNISLITTALFITHPVNVEAVGWISGYPYVLRAIIVFGTLIFYSLFRKTNSKPSLFISIAIYSFGMLYLRSSGWLFVTPFILVFIDQFIFEKKIKIVNIKFYIAFLIISLAAAAMLIPGFYKQRVSDLQTLYYVDPETSTPLVNRIPYTIYMEYRLLAFPLHLSIYHEGKVISSLEYTYMVIISTIIVFLMFHLWKKDRVISGMLFIILFSILPSFSPIIIAWTAAERYYYVASAFFSAIIAILIFRAEEKYKIKHLALILFLIVFLFYSIRTVLRTNDYKDSKHLWFASRKVAPYSYRVYNNLGDVYADEKNLELAIDNFKRSVALKPDYADAVHNIGYIYWEMGDVVRAKRYLTQALAMNPRLYQSAATLAEISYVQGDFIKSREYFQQCLVGNPISEECSSALAKLTAEGH